MLMFLCLMNVDTLVTQFFLYIYLWTSYLFVCFYLYFKVIVLRVRSSLADFLHNKLKCDKIVKWVWRCFKVYPHLFSITFCLESMTQFFIDTQNNKNMEKL